MRIGFLDNRQKKFTCDVIKNLKIKKYDVSFADIHSKKYDMLINLQNSQKVFLKKHSLNNVYVLNNPFSYVNDILLSNLCENMGIPHKNNFVVSNDKDIVRISSLMNFPVSVKPVDSDDFFVLKSIRELKDALKNSVYDELLVKETIESSDIYRVFCFNHERFVFVKYSYLNGYSSNFVMNRKMFDIERDSKRISIALDMDFVVLEWAIDLNGNPIFVGVCNEVSEISIKMPPEKYSKIVEFFSEMVEKIAISRKKNKYIFDYT